MKPAALICLLTIALIWSANQMGGSYDRLQTFGSDGEYALGADPIIAPPAKQTTTQAPATSSTQPPPPQTQVVTHCASFDDRDRNCLAAFMHGVAELESSCCGDYDAESPWNKRHGTAKGKWQWIDSTWRSHCGDCGYATPFDAPDHVQDQIAAEAMLDYFDRWGAWTYVGHAWHSGPGGAQNAYEGWNGAVDGVTGLPTNEYVQIALGHARALRP